jgi:alpha-tubulin suppressor-like RCC1 family protein
MVYLALCSIESGELYTFGEGKFGRLGHNSERNQLTPRLVEALIGKSVKQVACGGFHTACVTGMVHAI